MRSLAPFGMSLRGVGTGRCVRASTGRADDAETCSGFVLGAASSKPFHQGSGRANPGFTRAARRAPWLGAWHFSRWHVGVRRVGQHAASSHENCAGPLAGGGGFLGLQ